MPYFIQSQSILLDVSGKDSTRYLNARLSNDIRLIDSQGGILAAALTPQGKTQALFAAYRWYPERVLLHCDAGEREVIVKAFKQYLVADRVEVKDLSSEYLVFHLFDESVEEISAIVGVEVKASNTEFDLTKGDSNLVVSRLRSEEIGYDLVLRKESAAIKKLEESGIPLLGPDQARTLRIRAGVPAFPDEINEQSLFAESGLRHAISFKKGCYVGQEVIERVDAIGRVPRRLWSLEVGMASYLEPGVSVLNADGLLLGKIVSAVSDSDSGRGYAFAYLKNDRLEEGSQVLVGDMGARLRRPRLGISVPSSTEQ